MLSVCLSAAGNMESRVGGLLFTSKFDSGNLDRVEKVVREDEEESSK